MVLTVVGEEGRMTLTSTALGCVKATPRAANAAESGVVSFVPLTARRTEGEIAAGANARGVAAGAADDSGAAAVVTGRMSPPNPTAASLNSGTSVGCVLDAARNCARSSRVAVAV